MINLPNITTEPCIVPPSIAGSCSSGSGVDGSFVESLTLKPASIVVGVMGTILFETFLEGQVGEIQLLAGLTYSSSNPAILSVNATTGNATGLQTGIVTVSVTWQDFTAFAQVQVMAGNYCESLKAAMFVVIDSSKSMGIQFDAGHGTRFGFAKTLAAQFISEINYVKDTGAFAGFDVVVKNESVPTFGLSEVDLLAVEAGLTQSTQQTALELLQTGLDTLNAATANRRVLVVFTDGEDTASHDLDGFLENAQQFKSNGGVIVVVGLRASGAAFTLLSNLSSGGFFLNAIPSNADDIAGLLSGFKGYFCAGACGIGPNGYFGYGTGCAGEPAPAQIEDLNPPEPVEAGTPPPGQFSCTRPANSACQYSSGIGSAVPVMTSPTAPSGTVTQSNQTSGFEAWRAFGSGSPWRSPDLEGWIAYQFPTATTIRSFALRTIGATVSPFSYQFWIEGSNDGFTWVILAHPNTTEISNGATAFIPIDNPGSYLSYRLRYQLSSAGPFGITELTYYTSPKSSTATATRTSSVSVQDACAKAQQAAQVAADGAINCCTNAVTIIDQAPATPFPACYRASYTGAVGKVTVTLTGLTHPNPSDICMVLVGPGGQMVRLMSGCGSNHAIAGVNIVFDDAFPAMTSAAIVSGNYGSGGLDSNVPPLPCPQPPYGLNLAVFNGINATGTWYLFIVDTAAGSAGSLQSWTVNFHA